MTSQILVKNGAGRERKDLYGRDSRQCGFAWLELKKGILFQVGSGRIHWDLAGVGAFARGDKAGAVDD